MSAAKAKSVSKAKCLHCHKTIRPFIGARDQWWVHEASRSQTCDTGIGGIAQPEADS